jgi:hypothetical protein
MMGQPDDNDDAEAAPMPSKPARSKKATVPDAAFDVWLRRGLHQIFDDVAREPIPPELLRLIEQDRKK